VCATLMMILAVVASAQDRDDVIKIDTELVSFEVTVVDKNGKPVRNLKEDEFRVFEDGTERSIDFFQPLTRNEKDRPLSVVFALDVSGSMTDAEIERLRFAMQSFISSVRVAVSARTRRSILRTSSG